MTSPNYLPDVRAQYEDLPYPLRNPEDDLRRIACTEIDFLGKIGHYGFEGRLDLGKPLRVLVAGGGTGDAAIFLAEQLRETGTRVVCLDISLASMDIARRRAVIRGLDNIEWIHGSLLDLPQMDSGKFDYINCSGVLHHLVDPVRGLQALAGCLNNTGLMGIMVYGQYGRTGIYQMQELLRHVNADVTDPQRRLTNARMVLAGLPQPNWLQSGPVPVGDIARMDDNELFDLFLHSQDRAYTVPQLYEWLSQCGLHLIDFTHNRPQYDPATFIQDEPLLAGIRALPRHRQQSIAELLSGTLTKHSFYAARARKSVASIEDLDNIPYFCDGVPVESLQASLYESVRHLPTGAIAALHFPNMNIRLALPLSRFTHYFLKYLDGATTVKKLLYCIRNDLELGAAPPAQAEIMAEFRELFTLFNRHDLLLLRHKRTKPFKTLKQLQARVPGNS